MKVVGIDPGITGGIALIHDAELVEVVDMPVLSDRVSGHGIASLLAAWGAVDGVVVESVAAFPKNGSIGNFKLGVSFGVVLGVLNVLERRIILVRPAAWTKDLRVGADKSLHRQRATERFPSHAERFARVKDDGRADAVLLAEWGMRSLLADRGLEVPA